jgi:hypothetical protein
LESGMDELLAQWCQLAKISQVAEFKKWTNEVKKIDDLMRVEHREFERIARATRENQRRDMLTENLRRVNVPNTSTQRSSSKNDGQTRCPRLTQNERTLLMSNEGCLICRKFFAGHRSTNCPNDFPSVANYRSLTQVDVDRTRKSTRLVATVTAAGSNNHDEGLSTHPIAAVMGMSHGPTAYTAANPSAIIEGDSDSDNEVSPHYRSTGPSEDMGDLVPLQNPHLHWSCIIQGTGTGQFIMTVSLIDPGSHLVVIDENFTSSLSLQRHSLEKPEKVGVAFGPGNNNHRTEIILKQWVKLYLHDPSLQWRAKPVRAMVAPNLCSPLILGLPFLSHNHIVIDTANRLAVDSKTGFDLMNVNKNNTKASSRKPPKEVRSEQRSWMKKDRNALLCQN